MKIQKLNENTYLLKEACFYYLLVGSQKAMLIDSGAGLKNPKPYIQKIIGDKELIVVSTHGHLDHFGGNRFFKQAYIPEFDAGVYKLHNSQVFRKWVITRFPFFVRPFLKRYLVENPDNTVYYDENTVFDLGDRLIEVLATPGHTVGSVCLLDRKNRLFFGNDTFVSWGVLLNLDYSLKPEVFKHSMLKIKKVINEFDRILPGHHEIDIPMSYVDDYIHLADMAINYEGDYVKTEFGLCRVVTYNKLKLFYKNSY